MALQTKFCCSEIASRSFQPGGESDCERTQWCLTDSAAPVWLPERTVGITNMGRRSTEMNMRAIRYGE
jgi:hypothetical protein